MTLNMIMLGQILLSIPVLLIRAKTSIICLPLSVFLLASGLLAMIPIVSVQFPNWYQFYSALVFPALFTLCPALWFYVEGITADNTWKFNSKHLRHFILLWPALLISILMLLLPNDIHTAIFIDDTDVADPLVIVLLMSLLVIILLWLGQCVYTIFIITRRLINYRKQLKNAFANHEGKKLNWMNWLLFVAISAWLFSLLTLFSSSLFNNLLFNTRAESLLSLLLIWSMAHFGLQQKPAFFEYSDNIAENITTQNDEQNIVLSPTKKYQRSALETEQSNRIAKKINDIMREDKLYLDSSISLQKLSSTIAISPNYISQTLNETLSTNFFDFINQWRIKAAIPKILANDDTVLNIALEVGFNARSSFYKAFKQETGKTPSEFRKLSASTLKITY